MNAFVKEIFSLTQGIIAFIVTAWLIIMFVNTSFSVMFALVWFGLILQIFFQSPPKH